MAQTFRYAKKPKRAPDKWYLILLSVEEPDYQPLNSRLKGKKLFRRNMIHLTTCLSPCEVFEEALAGVFEQFEGELEVAL